MDALVATSRKTPAGLDLAVTPSTDTTAPYVFTATGKLKLPPGMSKADGCQGVIVTRFRYKGTVVATRFNELNGSCRFTTSVGFSATQPTAKGTLRVRSKFGGSDFLKSKTQSPAVTVHFGK